MGSWGGESPGSLGRTVLPRVCHSPPSVPSLEVTPSCAAIGRIEGVVGTFWRNPPVVAESARLTPLRSRFACLQDCASAWWAAAGSVACCRSLGSRPTFWSCSSPTEFEGTANCGEVQECLGAVGKEFCSRWLGGLGLLRWWKLTQRPGCWEMRRRSAPLDGVRW